jgi:hypothetical protein
MTQGEGFGRALLMACDATGYGRGDDQLQDALQAGLIKVLDEAATGARLVRSEWDRNSTGDGELALLPVTESEPRVVDDFIRELCAALARHNRHLADHARLRLRVAIHYGVAYPASNGYSGQGVVVVSRLLDSAPLREAMRQTEAELALILSDGVYLETVAGGHTSLRPGEFREVDVRNKEFAARAWIWLPHSGAQRLTAAPQAATGQSAGPAADGPETGETAAAGIAAAAQTPQAADDPGVEREGHRLTAMTEFHGPVHAPGSVFGISLPGR